jgi:hypothetical protein
MGGELLFAGVELELFDATFDDVEFLAVLVETDD